MSSFVAYWRVLLDVWSWPIVARGVVSAHALRMPCENVRFRTSFVHLHSRTVLRGLGAIPRRWRLEHPGPGTVSTMRQASIDASDQQAIAASSDRLNFAPLVFAAIGPPIGLFIVIAGESRVNLAVLFFALIASYGIGVMPALASGCLHSLLGFLCLRVLGVSRIGLLLGSALGAVSGLASMMAWSLLKFGSLLPQSNGLTQLLLVGTGAGAVCGAVVSLWSNASAAAQKSEEEAREFAKLSPDGDLIGPHGRCPNCEALVALDALACPRCHAEFGENAVWRPTPLVR